jgi:N-methylhydantoinase B
MGDIAAQLTGCLMGRDLTAALADKYSIATFVKAVNTMLDQSEAAARARIRAVPDGIYTAEAFLDNDGESDEPVPIKVKVVVEDDEMTVDFSEMADEVPGRLNSGYYGGGRTSARVAFMYLVAKGEAANEGTFRPLKLILPPGKLLSASPTRAMGNYSQPLPTVIDCIIKALEDALPERTTGAHFGSFSGVRYRGRRPDQRPFDCHDSGHGGWGACATHDGAGPFRTMAHGDTRIIPMELQESMYPYRIESLSLRTDSAGPGTYRGGLGFKKTYTILSPCRLQLMFDRVKCPPWGVRGGGTAKAGQVTIVKPSGKRDVVHKVKEYFLERGDMVYVETGGGGGYGPPDQRAVELVQRDLIRGYISIESAEKNYGVTVDRKTLTVHRAEA